MLAVAPPFYWKRLLVDCIRTAKSRSNRLSSASLLHLPYPAIGLAPISSMRLFISFLVPCAAILGFASIFTPIAHALAIEEATIADLQAAYQTGELTTHQVVAAYLARIEAYDKQGPYINSIINLNPKALEEADKLDAALKSTGKLSGPLHGIPVLVKDCI